MEDNSKLRNTATKIKDRRQTYGQNESQPKRIPKQGLLKRDFSQLVPPSDDSSPVNKVLNEANKIVKIGMEREFALLEKNNTLQNSNDTIDNLRKNILHLQMEYEKLDQNYQREISYRSEIIKRMDVTKDMVESAVQYSNTLAVSVKQVEEDKLKIVEFYELIHQNQKDVEIKQAKVEKYMKDQEEILKSKLEDVQKSHERNVSQHSEAVMNLNKKLSYANDRLKVATTDQEKLRVQNQELQETVNTLEASMDQHQKQNYLLQGNTTKFKCIIKKLKKQRSTYQKLWRNKKKEISDYRFQNKNLKKSLSELETLYENCLNTIKLLEKKNSEWESKSEEDGIKYQAWEAEKEELVRKLTNLEKQKKDVELANQDLGVRIEEVMQTKKSESDQLQNDLSKMFEENLKLKEDLKKLSEDNDGKAKRISDLEVQVNDFGNDLNSEVAFYKDELGRCKSLEKEMEAEMAELQRELALERNQKETALVACEHKLNEKLKLASQKAQNLEKILEEKAICIAELESKLIKATIEGQNAVGKVNAELHKQQMKNEELNTTLKDLADSREVLHSQAEKFKKQISELEGKLNDEKASRNSLEITRTELEETVARLREERDLDKKSLEISKDKQKMTEKDLDKMKEENAGLKSTVAELRNLMEDTEARLEAYKVVVKKLESEKFDARSKQSEEVLKLKQEVSRLEEAAKLHVESSQRIMESNSNTARTRLTESVKKTGGKENQQEESEVHKALQTPQKATKMIISTPRKPFTSTPKCNFWNQTPIKKKRDPYEFDSDSSVERFEPDKAFKVFNRQKKDSSKRSKTVK